jgi:hypothetical protein
MWSLYMGRIRARIPAREELCCHIDEVEPACLAPAVDYLLDLGGRSPQRRLLIERRLTLAALWYRFGHSVEARLVEQARLKKEASSVVKVTKKMAEAMGTPPAPFLKSEFLAVFGIEKRAQSMIAKMASPDAGRPLDYATKALVWALASVYLLETGKPPTISKNPNSADKRSQFHKLVCMVVRAIDPERGDISPSTCQNYLDKWKAATGKN